MTEFVKAAEQPPDDIEFQTIDDVFIKVMQINKAGTYVPQHSHAYDHGSFLAHGSIRVWQDGKLDADYHAPCLLHIRAGVKHLFQALEDNTRVLCIHNVSRAEIVEILERHDIVKES